MKYFKLMYDNEHDNKWIMCRIIQGENHKEYAMDEGIYISESNKKICLEYNPMEGNAYTDYLANDLNWFTVSNKFQLLLDDIIKDEVQYLSTEILNVEKKEKNTSYCVANIVDIVDALDLENSVYDYYDFKGKRFLSVRKYALNGKEAKGHHIFRLKDYTIPIFVSEEVRNRIVNAGLTGFDFLEVKVCD